MAPPVDTSDRLAKMSLFYHREAERCIGERAYFAACILTAAALEAILLSMCYVEDRAVRRAAAYKQKRFKFARNRFLEFNLYQLIGIAAELKWIPSNEIRVNGRKTTLEELLHTVRTTRNLIHPGVWAKEGGPGRMSKSTYESIYEIFDVTREWLLQRVTLGLRRTMHEEGILCGTRRPGRASETYAASVRILRTTRGKLIASAIDCFDAIFARTISSDRASSSNTFNTASAPISAARPSRTRNRSNSS
jgi:hypothetical protein